MNFNTEYSFTRNFAKWAHEDSTLDQLNIKIIKDNRLRIPKTVQELKYKNFSRNTIISLYGLLKGDAQVGYARFGKIRILTYNWQNGDQINFPINSNNKIYLGNDSEEWISFWPFLRKSLIVNSKYTILNLPFYSDIETTKQCKLVITGQKHYGHFVMNHLIGLRNSQMHNPMPNENLSIIHPNGYSDLNFNLITQYAKIRFNKNYVFPQTNCIFEASNCIVPAVDEFPFGLIDSKGYLEQNNQNRRVRKGKLIYISRAVNGNNDRLSDFKLFLSSVEELGFSVVNPTELSFENKLELLGDAEIILSDSGTCWVNGLLFSNKESIILNMIPKRILVTQNLLVLGQLCMNIGLFVENMMLSLEPHKDCLDKVSNYWYDKCIAPTKKQLTKALLEARLNQC